MFWHDIKKNAQDLSEAKAEFSRKTSDLKSDLYNVDKNAENRVQSLRKDLLATLESKIANSEAVIAHKLDELEAAQTEKLGQLAKTTQEGFENAHAKAKTEITGMADRLEHSFLSKIHELKLFKAGQEEMEKNPLLIVIVQELVRRQFIAVETELNHKEDVLKQRAIDLDNLEKELKKTVQGSFRSKKEIADKIKEHEEERLKFERLSNTDIENITFDKHELKYGVEALVARAKRDILKWAISQN